VRFQNGSNKVAIELHVVQFWSEIILVISNRTHAMRSFDFEITRMISDQIALHSVQLPLYIKRLLDHLMRLFETSDFRLTFHLHEQFFFTLVLVFFVHEFVLFPVVEKPQ